MTTNVEHPPLDFMVRQLQPWDANRGKGRQVEAPKVYLYPGDQRYTLDRQITVVPLADVASDPRVIKPTTRGRQR